MKFRWKLLVGAVCTVSILGLLREEDPAKQYVHPPQRVQWKHVDYDPDRIIRMTLHEYLKGKPKRYKHETTGRYVTFGIPMKYVANHEVYSDLTPARVTTFTSWEHQPDGTPMIRPARDARGVAPRAVQGSRRFRAELLTTSYFMRQSPGYRLAAARSSGAPFPGYQGASMDIYWLRETYCGFDVFEEASERIWHRRAERLEDVPVPDGVEPPFDHARIFGLPDGDGNYPLSVVCKDGWGLTEMYCTARASFNDFVWAIYGFDRSLICEIEEVIDAHMNLMRQWIVDQSLEKRPELR